MKIDHVALFCVDLERLKAFFLKYFDATSNEQYHNPRTELRTYILSFPDDGSRLELMTRPEVNFEDMPNFYRHGFVHLSFALGSKQAVDKLTARLDTDGYEILSGPRITGDGYYETAFLGPEDIQIEITV